MSPTARSQTVPMAPATHEMPDSQPSDPRPSDPHPEAVAAAAGAASPEAAGALRREMRANVRKVVERSPAALLVGALVGLVPVVVTMMIYTLSSFGARIDDTNAKIDDAVVALGARIDDTSAKIDDAVAALGARIDDTNAHVVRLDGRITSLEERMDARFAAQDAKISQLGQDVAQLNRDVAQLGQSVAQVGLDVARVLAVLVAQFGAGPESAASPGALPDAAAAGVLRPLAGG